MKYSKEMDPEDREFIDWMNTPIDDQYLGRIKRSESASIGEQYFRLAEVLKRARLKIEAREKEGRV